MRDVEPGCEGAVLQLERWTHALMGGNVDALDEILSTDFQFTVEPRFAGGRMNKEQFIAFDRKIRSCEIDLEKVIARKMGSLVTILTLARVNEEFSEDLGPDMPSRAEMSDTMKDARLAYGSGFREDEGRWQCFSHHIFGFVEG
jgi:hypothetical protein